MSSGAGAAPAAGGGDEADVEAQLKQTAEFLEMLKVMDPAQYQQVMTQLQAEADAAKGFAPKMPGGGTMGQKGVEEAMAEGVDITPEPAFVVKTSAPRKGGEVKVFINVTQSEHVANFTKKKQLNDKGEEEEGINIPLSLGPPRNDKDKKGHPCLVYDVIVNPGVIRDAEADKTGSFRHFVVELALQYVQKKYRLAVSHQYKLPRLKYKGETVPSQRIRKSAKPLIEEVRSPGMAAGDSGPRTGIENVDLLLESGAMGAKTMTIKQTASSEKGAAANKDYYERAQKEALGAVGGAADEGKGPADGLGLTERVKRRPAPVTTFFANSSVWFHPVGEPDALKRWTTGVGDLGEGWVVVVRVHFKEETVLPAEGDLGIEAGPEFVCITARGYHPTELFLPGVVDPDTVDAVYDHKTQMLNVACTTRDADSDDGPDPGSRPWMLSRAIETPLESSAAAASGSAPAAPRYSSSGPVQEDEVLPEDRFHKADIVSSHILMQKAKEREESRKKKAEMEEKPFITVEEGGGGGGGGGGGRAGAGGGDDNVSKMEGKVEQTFDPKAAALAKAAAEASDSESDDEDGLRNNMAMELL